jgi:hypothetical protein
MRKMIKGNPRRKPPEPVDHSEIEGWIGGVMPRLQAAVSALDDLICTDLSGLTYGVKFSRAFYGLPDLGWVIEVAAYHKTFNVLFLGGAEFGDPPPLGETSRMRFVKLDSIDDIGRDDLRGWIGEAGRTPGWA